MTERIHIGRGTYDGRGVTVFPVWLESPEVHGFCWKPAHLAVSEIEAGASVNNLVVTNANHRPIIAIEGDIFEGGLQNRMLARSLVVGRGERHEVAVACVEQGRWHGVNAQQASTSRASYGVRYGLTDVLAAEHAESGGTDAGTYAETNVSGRAQGEVWERIRTYEAAHGEVAGHSLLASMAMTEREAPTELLPVTMIPGQRGVIIGIGGYIAAAEFFGGQSGLAARWDAIIAAARYEALSAPKRETPGFMARDLARLLERTPIGENLSAPEQVETPMGPLAVSSFALGFGLIHAAVFNGGHPVLARV